MWKLVNKLVPDEKKELLHSLIIAVAVTVIVTVTLFLSVSYAEASCEESGGSVVRTESGELQCIVNYKDGGKSCKTSNDCEGRCYVHEDGKGPTCEYDHFPGKCRGTLSDVPMHCD